MFQRLPIALAQIKAGNNNSESLLNEIRQIVYSLYQLLYAPARVVDALQGALSLTSESQNRSIGRCN